MQVATTGTEGQRTKQSRRESEPRRTFDSLAALSFEELGAIYADGSVPDDLARLDGDLVGRMLAVRGSGHGGVFRALSAFARRHGFPWAGKSFQAIDAKAGKGINRIRLGGRHRLFPFRTYVGPSVVDRRPSVFIDYDDPDNPGLIRAIHDEVREVESGLFLGPACWKRSAKGAGGERDAFVVLWFALDARGLERGLRAV